MMNNAQVLSIHYNERDTLFALSKSIINLSKMKFNES